MRCRLVLFIGFFLFSFTLAEADKFPISWDDPKLVPWQGGAKGVFQYKTPIAIHREEWEVKSAIAKDLTDLNLVSFPAAIISKKGETRFSVLDLLNLDSKVFAEYYKPYSISPSMHVWSYIGYDPITFKPNTEFEIKPVPLLRGRGNRFPAKYEHTEPYMSFKLPRVSKRIAAKVFPSLYSNLKKTEGSQEALDFWNQVLKSDIPIVIVEGHKKALSVLSLGIPAIGLLGACKGLRLYPVNGERKLEINKSLIKFMTAKKRTFYINFDNDKIEFIRRIVFSAAAKLGREIKKYGHDVKMFYSPDKNLKGADDFIVARGEKEYRKLILEASSVEQFTQQEKPYALETFAKAFLKNNSYNYCFSPPSVQCDIGRKFSKKYPVAASQYKKSCSWRP